MEQSQSENSYKSILKRISAFGGVQVFNVLLSLVRGKFVAMFLGPAGMGVSSLFTSSANTLQLLGGMGLNLALVKETSVAKDEPERMREVMAVALRLIIFTSLFGGLLCLILSPLLSLWTFGSADYTMGFMLLSVSVALSVAGSSYLALLQGVGAVKRLAKASLVGGLVGLFCGVPLYYFFGTKGIVPGMIILSASTFLFYFLSFRRSGFTAAARFDWQRHKPLVKRFLSIGLVLMVGSLVGTLAGYLINLYVREFGSVEDVGLFQAANSLTNQYVGIIFSALALDYFPRLSAAVNNPGQFNDIVNRQIEIVSLIITPLAVALIVSAPLVIRILLTGSFLSIIPLIKWMGVGVLLQACAFPLGYVFIVKNNTRLYFAIEVVMSTLLWLGCSILFYSRYGLIGLGVSLVVRTIIGDTIAYLALRRFYGIRLAAANVRNILVALSFAVAAFLISDVEGCPWWIEATLFVASALLSAISLKRKL